MGLEGLKELKELKGPKRLKGLRGLKELKGLKGLKQGGKSETPRLQLTRCTPKLYRRFACKFFSGFNASGSQFFAQ